MAEGGFVDGRKTYENENDSVKKGIIHCCVCIKKNLQNEADKYCLHCLDYYCQECVSIH